MNNQTELFFFNTIHLSGDSLEEAKANVENQGNKILSILKREDRALTPFEVSKLYDGLYRPCPITSIRRAMSDLTRVGFLEKTHEKKEEKYGKSNFKWRIKSTKEDL